MFIRHLTLLRSPSFRSFFSLHFRTAPPPPQALDSAKWLTPIFRSSFWILTKWVLTKWVLIKWVFPSGPLEYGLPSSQLVKIMVTKIIKSFVYLTDFGGHLFWWINNNYTLNILFLNYIKISSLPIKQFVIHVTDPNRFTVEAA